MKSSKIINISIVISIFLLLMISSTSLLGYYNGSEGGGEPYDSVGNPILASIIEDINVLKEKILESSDTSWKKPAHIRKTVMLTKLDVLKKQVGKNNLDSAYNKMLSDIKPKLTTSWVTNEELQVEFDADCENILDKIETLMTPDVDPPVIVLTPDQTISDENALGGLLIEWEITDQSGISEAIVTLNGDVIASYTASGTISDSYLLANTPGNYLIEITAIDNNGYASSAQSFISITDDDTTAPIITLNYYGTGTEYDPGWWDIVIEDPESGLDEVQVLLNGYVIIHDQNLNGQQSITYPQVDALPLAMTQILEVTAINNDKDGPDDQQSTYETDIITVVENPDVDPPIIMLTPSQTITDSSGGLTIEWEISDESGISEATVTLNGDVIASYAGPSIVSDSILLDDMTPGDKVVQITAIDTNGLVSTAQSIITFIDDDTTAPTISIQYFGSENELDPGYWYVSVEDLESGIGEVYILINGYDYIDESLGGVQSIIYVVDTPSSIMTHTIEVIVTNNDNDWNDDQETTSETDEVTIVPSPIIIPG